MPRDPDIPRLPRPRRSNDAANAPANAATDPPPGVGCFAAVWARKSASERERIENGEAAGKLYHIIATIGDQASDLAGGHAECGFKIPNPFYFIP